MEIENLIPDVEIRVVRHRKGSLTCGTVKIGTKICGKVPEKNTLVPIFTVSYTPDSQPDFDCPDKLEPKS